MTLAEKVWASIAGAIYALLLAAAMLPGSRYYVRTDASYLRGNWFHHTGYMNEPDTFAPPSLDPDTWTTNSRSSRLAAALEQSNRFLTSEQAETPQLDSLAKYCDANPDDVEAWAQLARRSANGAVTPQSTRLDPKNVPILARLQMLRFKASAAGMRLEPGNAFFVLVHAGAMMAAGNHRQAAAEYLAASRLGYYHDYTISEMRIKEAAIRENYGDVGSTSKILIRQAVLLPHYAFIKSMTKPLLIDFPNQIDEVRAASARIGGAMMRGRESIVESLVGASIFRITLPKGYIPAKTTAQLDAASGQQLFAPMERRADNLKAANAELVKTADADDKNYFVAAGWRPRWSGSALAMLIFSFPIGFVLAWRARRKAGRQEANPVWLHAFVVFAGLLAVGVLVSSANMPTPNLLGMIFLAAITATTVGAAFIPPGRTSGWTLGGSASVACALLYLGTVAWNVNVEHQAAQVVEIMAQREQTAMAAGL